MKRLILADLRQNPRPWIGLAALAAAIALVTVVIVSFLAQTGTTDDPMMQQFFSALGTFIAIATAISVLVIAGGAAKLSVTLRRRTFALWMLVGLMPRHVFWVTMAQLVVVAVLGAVVGSALGALVYVPFYEYGLSSMPAERVPEAAITPAGVLIGGAVAVGTVVIAGIRGARSASRTEPIVMLRDAEPRRARGRWVRWILGAIILAGTFAFILSAQDYTDVVNYAMLVAPGVLCAVAVAGPVLYAPVIRAWTAILPARISASWFLARNAARFRVGFAAAAIGPIVVAVVLPGGLYSAGATLSTSANATGDFAIEPSQIVVMLGGPLLLALVGAAAAVYVTGSDREHERALLSAAGARSGTLNTAALWEAVILVSTGILLAALTLGVSTVLITMAMGDGWPVVTLAPIALVAAISLVLMIAATLIPALATSRRPILETLRVDA